MIPKDKKELIIEEMYEDMDLFDDEEEYMFEDDEDDLDDDNF